MADTVHYAGITDTGRAQRGVDFIRAHNSIWMGFGRVTPWPDETKPPPRDRQATTVEEMFGLKLFDQASLVVRDDTGPIINDGLHYRAVTNQEGLDQQTPLLCVRFVLETDEFPLISYRQIGVFVDAIPQEGLSSFSALQPAQFRSLGRLFYNANVTLVQRYPNTKNTHFMITPPEADGPLET